MKTTSKAAAPTKSVSEKPTNGAVVKLDHAKQAQDMKSRIERINVLSRKTNQLFRLRESMHDLAAFKIDAAEVIDSVVLRDSEGNTWRTSNQFIVGKIQETVVAEFERKSAELETEILSATF